MITSINITDIKVVNPKSKESWRSFLDCGKRIRERNNPDGFAFWKDTEDVRFVLDYKKIRACRFWMISDKGIEGRLGVVIRKGDPSALLGWFECDNDGKLSKKLFDLAFNWCKKQHCEKITGPVNGSTWYNYRLNITNSCPLFIGEPFQPLYYPNLLQKEGFSVSTEYVSNFIPVSETKFVSFEKADQLLQKKGLKLEKITESVYTKNRTALHRFLVEVFSENPLYAPIDLEEFGSIYDDLPANIPDEFSYILFDKNQQPVGLCLAYPDSCFQFYANKKVNDRLLCKPKLIVKTMAIHDDWKNQKIASLLLKLLNWVAQKNQLTYVVHALIHRQNLSLNISQRKFETNTARIYALFEKRL